MLEVIEKYIQAPKIVLTEDQRTRVRNAVDALREGSFRQTQRRLHDQYGYCCLGVMCELSQLGKWVSRQLASDSASYMAYQVVDDSGHTESDTLSMPSLVADFYGLEPAGQLEGFPFTYASAAGSWYSKGGENESLSNFNDVGLTFDQLSDVIGFHFDLEPEDPRDTHDPADAPFGEY